MDYIEAFKNLRTNNKYGRKSPHKAVLMLTVIELYEQNILTENEICYDDTLKSMFLKVWNRVLPDEPLYHPEAYFPFWYLQSDSFWHIVPVRGREDILSLMRDTNIKPSEAKLKDSIRCVELDDDLYFLMTIPSGRSSLKRALLETYTSLTEEQIDRLAKSKDNIVDYSTEALSEYEIILSQGESEERTNIVEVDDELIRQFQKLNEDIQIVLNIEYFSFLKKHRNEREMFKELCPTVYDLLDKIVSHPIKQGEISPSFAFTYDNFLSDLKISLMSEEGALEIIDKIGEAIDLLHGNDKVEEQAESLVEAIEPELTGGFDEREIEDEEGVQAATASDIMPNRDTATENRRGKPWTKDEEELISRYFQQGIGIEKIAENFGRTEVAIKSRLAKLGLIDYTYGQDETDEKPVTNMAASPNGFTIQNTLTRGYIFNRNGEKVFSIDGNLKYIRGKLYRINLKDECFTIKDMQFDGEVWMKGIKKIVAYPRTKLYCIMDDAVDCCEVIEDIVDSSVFKECRLKVKGEWYDNNGELELVEEEKSVETSEASKLDNDKQRITNHPLYAVRKQALLRAMGYFRLPVKIRDIARTISRTAWGAPIKEDDVEEIISTLKDVESSDGKYILRKK